MIISRLHVQNFRNFASLDVAFGGHALIVAENKVGKSNFYSPAKAGSCFRLITCPSSRQGILSPTKR